MAGYDPSGNFIDDQGQNLGQAQYTPNNGGFWYVLNAQQNGFVTTPAPPAQVNTDPRGPGGAQTTADPLHAGTWYRDNPAVIGGIERIDAQGNVVGSYVNDAPLTQGGSSFNIAQTDPATGGPSIFHYPTEQGGFMGLGDVWGSLTAVAMLAGIGASAGTLSAPLAASTPALIGAGATIGSAGLTVASQAAQNADLAKAAQALGLAGAASGNVSSLAGGSGSVGDYLSAAKTGLNVAGAATDDPTLRQAAQFAGYGQTASGVWNNVGMGGEAPPDTFTGGGGRDSLPGDSTGDTLKGSGTMSTDLWNYDPGMGDPTGQGDPYGSDIPEPNNPTLYNAYQGQINQLGDQSPGGSDWLKSLKTYAPLLAPALQAGGSIWGGINSGNAARDAATTQANAAREANALQASVYAQNRADLAPYRQVGYGALGGLTALAAQPLTYGAYGAPAPLDPQAYGFNPQQYAFNPQQYAFTPPSGQEVLNQDPGYAFRVQQGQLALDRQGAARGTFYSGGQLRGAARFGQDLASQEYHNAYQRALTQNQLGYERGLQGNQLGYERGLQGNQLAYGRGLQASQDVYGRGLQTYNTNLGTLTGLRQLGYNELAGLAGTGQTATSTLAGLGAQTGAAQAANLTSAGAAQAAGQVGQANAFNQGLSGVGNAANQYVQYSLLSDLLNRKAA